MLNYIWPFFLIISIIYSVIFKTTDNLTNGIFDYSKKAVDLSITFFGTLCMWSGIIEIIKKNNFNK